MSITASSAATTANMITSGLLAELGVVDVVGGAPAGGAPAVAVSV